MRLPAAAALSIVALGAGAPSPQGLRTCVDRWNQANMRDWGPSLVYIAVRRLVPAEAHNVGDYGPKPHCVLSIASKLREQTDVCVLIDAGAYECSRFSDGAPPLRRANGKLSTHGVLRVDVPLAGTHATPPLPWQRFPHVDGLIHPWTRAGRLRPGLSYYVGPRARGTCVQGSEYTRDRAALQCYSGVQYAACYSPTRNWNRRGAILACGFPGSTRFYRFVIARRS
jgi:hypothetical protein